MSARLLRLVAVAAATALVAAACTSDEAVEPTPAAVAVQPEAAACAPAGDGPVEPAGWSGTAQADPAFLPVVASSLLTVGETRFLYNVLDTGYRQIAAAELPSTIDFYALERDPENPHRSVAATYLPSGIGRGLYRATVDFDCVGEWGAEVRIEQPDGSIEAERVRFAVHPVGTTPAIGEAAPRSDSPVATTSDGIAAISTDRQPYTAAYDKTVAETVTSGRPSLVFFATPAFCQTGYCGPTVELVKGVAREHEGVVEFVNVEPYKLHVTESGLQPLLDEDGFLQPVPAALDYGIPVEPYLFLVDRQGDVFAKFEGIVGGDELRAAVEDVLAVGPDAG